MIPRGHPIQHIDTEGSPIILFGDPFPELQIPATYEAWASGNDWKEIDAPANPKAPDGSGVITPHRGSIAWNAHLGKWLTVFTQKFGKPSALGEVWMSHSDSPFGPWAPATKVLTHENYTFYNPVLHPELVPADADFILFEGTYSATFANKPVPTPRYDYNQILYRVDFKDLGFEPQKETD